MSEENITTRELVLRLLGQAADANRGEDAAGFAQAANIAAATMLSIDHLDAHILKQDEERDIDATEARPIKRDPRPN